MLVGVDFTGVELSEFAGFDLDRSTARAWSKFQARLADHVVDMDQNDLLLVEAESSVDDGDEGAAPYVQFCAWGEDLVRCEVSSNEFLADEHLLDSVGVETLRGLGWSAPSAGRDDEDPGEGSANFYIDLERSEADRLAVMAVRALRDVFGVAHPVFLSTDNLAEDDEPAPSLGVPASQSSAELDPDEATAVVARDREHLQELVDEALIPFFGYVPDHDEDDDIPVVAGSVLIFVRVLKSYPAIQMFSELVCQVTDLERAAFEVAVLNRDVQFIKFVLIEDRVLAQLFLPAWPFAPKHVRAMLALMAETVDEVDDDLAVRVGGRRTLDVADEEDPSDEDEDEDEDEDVAPFHPAMMTLLQLDADEPGSVDPELAASICGMDRDLILELLATNSEQEIAWRHARDEAMLNGDPDDEADVCDHEMRHAERTTNLLRRALRIVVERELGREPADTSSSDPRRRSPSKKRPSRNSPESADQTHDEIDPDSFQRSGTD